MAGLLKDELSAASTRHYQPHRQAFISRISFAA